MKILLLLREENTEEENQYYIDAIRQFGGEIFFVTDKCCFSSALKRLSLVDGILLPGGNDVGRLDFFLIGYALTHHLRLLGICQGMQSMALYGSGYKLEEIGNDFHYQQGKYAHSIFLSSSKLRKIFDRDVIFVNSHHHQTVSVSVYFSVVGRSSDNLIEAIENPNHEFQIGLQWHPERMISYDSLSRKLFQRFLSRKGKVNEKNFLQ